MSEKKLQKGQSSLSIAVPFSAPQELDHKGMINDANFHDLIITVDKQQILAHTYVVQLRCPILLNPKDPKKKPKKKKNITTIEVTSIPHKTLLDVFQFVYNGKIDLSNVSVAQAIQIYVAAAELELERLKWLCEQYIRKVISLENAFSLLKAARQFAQKLIEDICFYFLIERFTEVSSNKEGAKELGFELFQEIVDKYNQKAKGIEVKVPSLGPQPSNTLINDFKQICKEMQGADITFRFGNTYIPCHKGILAARSTELASLCSATPVSRSKEGPEHVLVPGIKGKEGSTISGEAFGCLIKFVYYGETSIPALYACELIPYSRDFGLGDLQYVCIETTRKNVNKDTALQINGITYLPQMEDRETISKELRQSTLDFILDHMDEVDLKPLKKMNPAIALDILFACQDRQKKGDKTNTPPSLHTSTKSTIKSSTDINSSALPLPPPPLVIPPIPPMET